MKNLEQQFSEDLSITKSLNSVREYSDPIPSDLLIDIFSRIPTEFLVRFRCVSKVWGSILRHPDFTELFLTKSLTRPRILFAIEDYKNELFLFSLPQLQNNHLDGDDYSLVATRYNDCPKYFPTQICPPLNGLVFFHGWDRRRVPVICNPVTGESITLPKVKETSGGSSYFGYDPINKQFKVLCMTYRPRYGRPNTHRILTLGTGKHLWRSTMECKPHRHLGDGICINGVLYYEAVFEDNFYMMVCFDFCSEKFSFLNMHQDMSRVYHQQRKLMNYKGKLCVPCFRVYHGNPRKLLLWVLEDDAGEHKWSKTICVLPLFCGANIRDRCYIVGITGSGEIVFKPYGNSLNPSVYLVFYNMESNTFTRVNIHGFQEFEHCYSCKIFLDYVENMTPMSSAFHFNKRRAEGFDKVVKTKKNLERKSR